MKKVNWLASYPKSGNTWVRLFLSELLAGNNNSFASPVIRRMISESATFLSHLDEDPHLLTQKQIDIYYPEVWEAESALLNHPIIKTHETFRCNALGKYIHPISISNSAVYIVRHPLDVCISLASFIGISFDDAITFMNTPGASTRGKFFQSATQLPSVCGSWSENVNTWLDQREIPCLLVRYEDLLDDPVITFGAVVKFLNLPHTEAGFTKAIEETMFGRLKEKERQQGFGKPPVTDAFFREGRKQQWKEVLTPSQIDRVISSNYDTMHKLNYI